MKKFLKRTDHPGKDIVEGTHKKRALDALNQILSLTQLESLGCNEKAVVSKNTTRRGGVPTIAVGAAW